MAQPTRHLHPVPTPEDHTTGALVPTRVLTPSAGRAQSWLAEHGATAGGLLRAGLHRHACLAADWIADPGAGHAARLAAQARTTRAQVRAEARLKNARSEAQIADATNALARAQREPAELEVTMRVAAMRAYRALVCASVPSGAVGAPVYLTVAHGEWATLLAWPGIALYLAVQEWAARRHPETADTDTAVTPGRDQITGDSATDTVTGDMTAAEERIIARAHQWDQSAPKRGLHGVALGSITTDVTGVRIILHTSGRLTHTAMAKKADVVRALLGVRTGTRVDITAGDTGDEVIVRVRTRRREVDTRWHPGRTGSIGVDTETGETVTMPANRWLVAGTSGAGKSVLLRVIMANALHAQEPTVVVYIDGKGEESALWVHCVRVAVEPEEILELVGELVAESKDRRDHMRSERVASWTPTVGRPRILVVVDEGAEVIAMDNPKGGLPILDRLCSLARTGRSRQIHVVWCTQKPTVGEGIPSQINGVMDHRIALRTANRRENNQVLDAEWASHELPEFGHVLVKGTGRGPDQAPVAVWDLSSDAAVRDLPDAEPWCRPDDGAGGGCGGTQSAVLDALRRAGGEATAVDVAVMAGYSLSGVKKALAGLREEGRVDKGSGHRDPWVLR